MKKVVSLFFLIPTALVGISAFANPKGTVDNPWLIGSPTAEDVVAYTNDVNALIIEGAGAMTNWNYSEADTSARPWNDIKSAITSVIICKGVTHIGVNAFLSCNAVASVTIPRSVTSIGDYAFFGCFKLANVMIPSSVTSIGSGAFESCRALMSVVMNSNTPPEIGSNAFGGLSFGTIYVPVGSVEAYKNASGWSDYEGRLLENNAGPWSIGDEVSASMSGKTLVIEGTGEMDNFESIEDVPWRGAEIEKVTIDERVTKIGKNAWLGMGESVTIDGVELSRYALVNGGFDPTKIVIPDDMILVTKESIEKAKAKTIAVVDGEVQLGISVKYSEDITAEPSTWKELEPFAISVPVKAKQGFIILRSN